MQLSNSTLNSNARVSVIIPCLNEEEFLPAFIDSIIQHGGDWVREVIVVDAGSTDQTVALAKSRGINVIEVDRSTIAAQRNRGGQAATGDLFAFLDADCTITPDWARFGIEAFEPKDVVSAGAPPDVPQTNTTWVQLGWSFLKSKASPVKSTVGWLASANVWVRAESFHAIGGFNEAFETCEDADLGFRLGSLGPIVSDPRIRVLHHREPKTLLEFYQKEVWHGKNSFDGVLSGRLTPAELPSLIAPAYFGMTLVLAIFFALGFMLGYSSIWLVLISLGLALALPAAYVSRAIFRKGNLGRAPQYMVIYCVYFSARTIAMLKWMARCCVFAKRNT